MPASKKNKILVIDDSKTTSFMISKILEKAGFVPLTAKTGKEALDIIEKKKPALALLDIMLPDIPGDSLLLQIKEKYPLIKIIIISSLDVSYTSIENLKGQGAEGFLKKPFKEKDLLDSVAKHI